MFFGAIGSVDAVEPTPAPAPAAVATPAVAPAPVAPVADPALMTPDPAEGTAPVLDPSVVPPTVPVAPVVAPEPVAPGTAVPPVAAPVVADAGAGTGTAAPVPSTLIEDTGYFVQLGLLLTLLVNIFLMLQNRKGAVAVSVTPVATPAAKEEPKKEEPKKEEPKA